MREHDKGPGAPDTLGSAIDQLEAALAALENVGVPLACAYVDLALSLCRSEQERRTGVAGSE